MDARHRKLSPAAFGAPARGSGRRSGAPRRRYSDERGVALVVGMAVAFVVILLSVTAVSQSMSSITQSGIAGRQVTSVDAAEAGVQTVINQITTNVSSGAGSFPCLSTAVTVAGVESYTLTSAVPVAGTVPATPTGALAACTGTLSLPTSTTVGENYLIAVKGSITGSTGSGSTVTEEVQVFVPPVASYAPSPNFPESVFAAYTLNDGGGLTVNGVSSYNVYAGLGGNCGSSGTGSAYIGDYNDYNFNPATLGTYPLQSFDSPTTGPTNFTNCVIGGDLDDNGVVTFSGGSVGGTIYSGDAPVTLSNSAKVTGSIYAQGQISLTSSTVGTGSSSSIAIGGSTLTSTSSTINGSIYAIASQSYLTSSGGYTKYPGNVTISGGTVNGSIEAAGTVTLSKSTTVTGSIYAGGTITTNGATVKGSQNSNYKSFPSQFNLGYLECLINAQYTGYNNGGGCSTGAAPFAQPASDPSLGTANSYYPQEQGQPGPLAGNVSITNGSPVTGTVFPSLTFDPNAWATNTTFCPPSSGYTRCVIVNSTDQTSCSLPASPNAICVINVTTCSNLTATVNAVMNSSVPTVITTGCEFNGNQTLAFHANLAVFDTSGFAFGSSTSIYSSNGPYYQFYAIVPSDAPTYSTAAAGTTESPTVTYATTPPSSMDSCAGKSIAGTTVTDGPDITIDGYLSDTRASTPDLVQTFFYTPQTICGTTSTDSPNMSGKLYAGYRVDLTANTGTVSDTTTAQTATLNPWVGSGTQAAPTVTFIKKLSGS